MRTAGYHCKPYARPGSLASHSVAHADGSSDRTGNLLHYHRSLKAGGYPSLTSYPASAYTPSTLILLHQPLPPFSRLCQRSSLASQPSRARRARLRTGSHGLASREQAVGLRVSMVMLLGIPKLPAGRRAALRMGRGICTKCRWIWGTSSLRLKLGMIRIQGCGIGGENRPSGSRHRQVEVDPLTI